MLENKDAQDTFGEFLKKERNMRGVTLEEISRKTNVNIKFLNAIENDEYEELPPDVFVRGFLQAYSRCIGLDTNEIILAYSEHNESETREGVKTSLGIIDKKIKFVENEKKRSLLFWFLLISSLGFISIFTYNYYEKINSKDKTIDSNIEDISTAPAEEEKSKVMKPKSKKTKDKKIPEKTKNKNGNTVKQATTVKKVDTLKDKKPIKKKPLSLSIYASENVWIKVNVDEKDPVEALLNIGEQITYTADNQFLLTLGNLKGSIITLDGEEIVLPDESRKNILRDYKITREEPEAEEKSNH